MNESDLQHLCTAIEVAWRAREHSNHPFGAVLVEAKAVHAGFWAT